MNERDCSIEALVDAEKQGMLTPRGFEQVTYAVVKEEHDPVVMRKIESALKPECLQSKNVVYSLIIALAEEAKTTEQLAYELGFGTRLPLFQPCVLMALDAGLIERAGSTDKSQEYWKIAK